MHIRFKGARRLLKRQMEQHNYINWLRALGNNPYFMSVLKPRKIVEESIRLFIDGDPEEYMVPHPETLMTPEQENDLMMWGQVVEPSVEEDLMAHMKTHLMAQQHPSYESWNVEAQAVMDQHVQATMRLMSLMQGATMGGEPALGDEAVQTGVMGREGMGQTPNAPGGTSDLEKNYF
jgi:hypothetical protein